MKSKLVKVLSLSAALNTAAAVLPTSISTVSAYAASSDGYIKDIKMKTNKGGSITLYTKSSCKSEYKISKLDDDEKIPSSLYGEVSDNVSRVNVSDLSLSNSSYTYKITKGGTEYDLDSDIKVSDGNNNIKVAVYDGSTLLQTYTIKIDKDDDDDDDDDDDMDDDVYLDNIRLSNNSNKIELDFNKKTSKYDIEVDNEITYLRVEAEPDDDDDRVKVNGVKVKEDDDWRTRVSLVEGLNKIEIEVRDEDDESIRNYTINVTRLKAGQNAGSATSETSTATNNTTNTSSTVTNTSANTETANSTAALQTAPEYGQSGWQMSADAKWHLYNTNGQLCKNAWYVDTVTNKSFYLDAVGNTASGWTTIDGKTYYFDSISGEKKTGWINIDGTWYHLDNTGVLVG